MRAEWRKAGCAAPTLLARLRQPGRLQDEAHAQNAEGQNRCRNQPSLLHVRLLFHGCRVSSSGSTLREPPCGNLALGFSLANDYERFTSPLTPPAAWRGGGGGGRFWPRMRWRARPRGVLPAGEVAHPRLLQGRQPRRLRPQSPLLLPWRGVWPPSSGAFCAKLPVSCFCLLK